MIAGPAGYGMRRQAGWLAGWALTSDTQQKPKLKWKPRQPTHTNTTCNCYLLLLTNLRAATRMRRFDLR